MGADGFLCSSGSCACACAYVGEQRYGIWLTLADYACFVLAELQHFWRLTCDSAR